MILVFTVKTTVTDESAEIMGLLASLPKVERTRVAGWIQALGVGVESRGVDLVVRIPDGDFDLKKEECVNWIGFVAKALGPTGIIPADFSGTE